MVGYTKFSYPKKEMDLVIKKYFSDLGINDIYLVQAINGFANDIPRTEDKKLIKRLAVNCFKSDKNELKKFNFIGKINSILKEFEQTNLINKKISSNKFNYTYLTKYSLDILTKDFSYPAIILNINFENFDKIIVSLTVHNIYKKYINPLILVGENIDIIQKLLDVYSNMNEKDLLKLLIKKE